MFEWTLGIVESSGYLGILFLMVLENIFPPIPSEIIIPVAGYAAAAGKLNIFVVMLVASLGSVVGMLPWYLLGRVFGLDRTKRLSEKYGRFVTMSPQDVDNAGAWFQKHGHKAVFFGRLIPTVRTLISVPAGLSRMKLPEFLAFSFAGSAVWTSLLALAGYFLESGHERVTDYLNPVSNAVVIIIVLYYFYRVLTFKRPQRS